MVQLGAQAHKAIKTTARTSVKCCGEASKCRRAQRGRAFLSRVYRLPGAELAPSPAGVVGQVADGAAETKGGGTASKWRSQDASPDLASFDLTVCPTHSLSWG